MLTLRSKYSSNTNATWRKCTYLLRGRTHKRRHSRVSKKWKKNYTHSRLLAFALAFTSNTCVSMLQHCWKGKVLFRFVSSWIWGACGVDVSVCFFHFFFFCFPTATERDPLPGKGWWVSRSRNWTRNIWIPRSVPSTISLAGTVAKLEVFPTRKHFKSTF